MDNIRPVILITNDDSIDAPGIHALVDIAKDFGDIYVVAPVTPRSGQSAAITVGAPLRIKEIPGAPEGVRYFTVDGTPVDCVKLALHAIVPRKPDFLFSGINHGSNSGNSITYSGTMGAVLEGCMNGIPSVGFSLLHHSLKADFSLSKEVVRSLIAKIIEKGLPAEVCLNINIPAKVVPEGVHVCRAARGHWTEEYKRYLDPQGSPFYWLTGRFINMEPDASDTDEYWLARRIVSVVPVSPDQSCVAAIKQLGERFNVFNN